ncbi:MAG TPA: nucleotidyl transferase AbiEii/AbiGii toxin family protein [Actinomycetota bacterium]|nr:nucleotidyl transferase AbiEii/AbiGii toxin family protein [Actinomycetota bacterium]
MTEEDAKRSQHEDYLERARGQIAFEAQERSVDEETFLSVVQQAIDAVEAAEIPYVMHGGLAVSIWGRPRWTHDLDLLVQPQHAKPALDALEGRGFASHETDPTWLFKALKDGVLVDVLFKVVGDIYLDDEMLAHARRESLKEIELNVISPEDLLIIKVTAFDEQTSRHWFDALGILAQTELDWDYLLQRARRSARRLLSVLLFAQSNDVLVPDSVVDSLLAAIRAD